MKYPPFENESFRLRERVQMGRPPTGLTLGLGSTGEGRVAPYGDVVERTGVSREDPVLPESRSPLNLKSTPDVWR